MDIAEAIRKDLIREGYRNKSIDYEEFRMLFEPYKTKMTEREFANILGMSEYGLSNIKSKRSKENKPRRTRILKEEFNIAEDRKRQIRLELINKGYKGKSIYYSEFKDLYEPYIEEMGEKEFARIIGISYPNYNNIRNSDARAIILKETEEVSEERRNKIIENLRQNGYGDSIINYEEFLDIYKPYEGEMSKIEFAEILGISYLGFNDIRKQRKRARILKDRNKIEKERKETIVRTLKAEGYGNGKINYEEFGEIYKPYKKEMSEREFARILGISNDNYLYIKNRNQNRRTRILWERPKRKKQNREEKPIPEQQIIEEMKKAYKRGIRKEDIIMNLLKEYDIRMVDLLKIMDKALEEKHSFER